jgi:hypothetical protein
MLTPSDPLQAEVQVAVTPWRAANPTPMRPATASKAPGRVQNLRQLPRQAAR